MPKQSNMKAKVYKNTIESSICVGNLLLGMKPTLKSG